MNRLTDFGYAQARLQARYAALPDAAMWQQAEGAGSLAHFLQNARRSELGRWLGAVGPQSGVHEAERAMRQQFRQHVAEVVRWHPPEWRGALLWTAVLVDLPLLEHLVRGNAPYTWMERDPVLRKPIRELDTSGRLSPDSPWFPLVAHRDRRSLGSVWLAHWRTLWPESGGSAVRHLETLTTGALERMQPLREERTESSGPALDAVRDHLARGFRRWPFQPAAAVAYLALVLLVLHRLRAGLSDRILFVEEKTS